MTRPYENDELLSKMVLGTIKSPGVCVISNHNRDKAWDVKAAKGQTGATSSLNGDPIGTFDAEFFLADDGAVDGPTDFDEWEDFQRLIESTTNGPKPVALPCYHPDLARQRYTEVVSGGIGGLVHDGKGGARVKVKFLEYRPPKPKPPAKAQPKADNGTGTREKPDPNAAAKAQLAALLEKARQP